MISDDYMREMLAASKTYSVVFLRHGPNRTTDGADLVIWEHGRRNFQLRQDGVLAIVCPLTDESEVAGIGIFDGSPEEIAKVMDGDPAVEAGVLTYEVHPIRSFPGDSLP